MALTFGDNISYQGKKPLDARFLFSTLAEMKNYSENYLPSLAFCQNEEDGKFYIYSVDNLVDTNTGKWREFSGSGAGGASPIGTIIPFMGNKAPSSYLACDGKIYNIADYKELAEFIKKEFGTCSKFGGDGTTTFGVPDLRGEFLRGTGTNSHTNQGNGADVGKHQDATTLPSYANNNSTNPFQLNLYTDSGNVTTIPIRDMDSAVPLIGQIQGSSIKADGSFTSTMSSVRYSTRPTNTSVLYCIKYTAVSENSTTAIACDLYDEEEICVGRWIDGRPLYRQVVTGLNIDVTGSSGSWIDIYNVPNMLKLIKAEFYRNYGALYKPLQYDNSSTMVRLLTNGTNCIIGSIIIEYTKTTDEPDSFTPDMITTFNLPSEASDEDIEEVFS